MDPVPSQFQPADAEVAGLVEAYPLAWLVASPLSALLLPLRPEFSGSGNLAAVRGHLPRSSSLFDRLQQRPRALILVTGESAYLSPSWMRNRAQAPTWASASAAFDCEVAFDEGSNALEESLRDLTDAMERDRPRAWSIDELGQRYASLARRIVPFRAEIRGTRAAFRLAQDEDAETFDDILAGLEWEGRNAVASAMRSARVRR